MEKIAVGKEGVMTKDGQGFLLAFNGDERINPAVKALIFNKTGGCVNIHPEFPETLIEFAPAYHEAPPVAVLSLTESQSQETTPDDLVKVKGVPDVLDCRVIILPELPVALKLETVLLLETKNCTDLGALIVNVLKVLLF